MKHRDLKIFELNSGGEKEWIVAYTNIQALKVHNNITDIAIQEFDSDDYIIEVPKEEWGNLKIRYNDADEDEICEETFSQAMERIKGQTYLCSTVY